MTDAPPVDIIEPIFNRESKSGEPLHSILRHELERVIDHDFHDGQRFWTENELIEHLNVSRITVRRALLDLSRAGRLHRYRAKGTFVRKQISSTHAPTVTTEPSQFSVLGVFIPRFNSMHLSEIIDSLNGACMDRNIELRIYQTHKGEAGDQAARQVKLQADKEAVIFLGNDAETTRGLYTALHNRGYRTVSIDTLLPDVPNAYVGANNDLGIRLGMRYLMDLGHQRIVLLVCEPPQFAVTKIRIAAFEEMVSINGLSDSAIVDVGNEGWQDAYEMTYQGMPRVMASNPTAIFAVSDTGAWAALKWFSEQNIKVPDQVSLLGFDDLRPSQFTYPSLSSIAQPYAEMVERALRLLESGETSHTFVKPTLSIRQSTGPVPASKS